MRLTPHSSSPRSSNARRPIFTLAALLALSAASLRAQAAGASATEERLGSIVFPTSGKPDAQADFIRGVLWLHSFEYDRAASAFRAAQRKDPGFALAYWGEAMTYTHPIWSQQDLAAARAVLARLAPTPAERAAKASTAREREYLAALELLYGEGSKPRRDTLFARAMERLAVAYPDDLEAQSFHALALMGLSQGVRNVPSYMRAGAIADAVFDRSSDHPGAAHYVIHAFDDPVHAPLGLRAARAYSHIAPSAGHAQHMTTHIFLALGMWPEVVRQNEIAQEASLGSADRSRWLAGHYTTWLGYALLQQGRFDAARAHLTLLHENQARSGRPEQTRGLLFMRAAYLAETERWTDPVVAWPLVRSETPADAHAPDTFARAMGALRGGRRAEAEAALALLERAGASPRETRQAVDPRTDVITAQLRALLLADAGRADSAIALLRRTATVEDTLPVEFGPPVVVKPTHELLGELLLAAGRAADAQREFTRALEIGPRRLRALAGLARSAAQAGDLATADEARRTLRESATGADAGVLDEVLRASSRASGTGPGRPERPERRQ